ncbi:MAG: hypothetical protein QM628_00330 [Propionicimonas sp.]
MSDDQFTPAPPPDSLGAGGRALWNGIANSFELMPEQLVQLEEACRAKDRLDKLDLVLRGDVDVWTSIAYDHDGEPISLNVAPALVQANATANLLKQLLAALRLPDEEGRRPQYRGARGAQAPSVPGGAKSGSAAERAASRWGA